LKTNKIIVDSVIRRMLSGMLNNDNFSISTLERLIYDP
jgi:hypothetical protein